MNSIPHLLRPFEGKVALVTGSSRGIGRTIAAHFSGLGAAVAVHGTTPESGRAFGEAESLGAVARDMAAETGSEILAVHGDLTDEGSVKRVVGEVLTRFGRIDILVNNAGGDIGAQGTAGTQGGKPQPNDAVFVSWADVKAVMDRNLTCCMLMCREVAPHMMRQRGGRIINISSTAALHGREVEVAYSVAKAGVVEYTRCLAAQMRRFNVTVNAVAPGLTVTPRVLARDGIDPAKMVKDGTLERYGWPIEIARAVAFFASEGGDYISGQVLRVDGGIQLWPA